MVKQNGLCRLLNAISKLQWLQVNNSPCHPSSWTPSFLLTETHHMQPPGKLQQNSFWVGSHGLFWTCSVLKQSRNMYCSRKTRWSNMVSSLDSQPNKRYGPDLMGLPTPGGFLLSLQRLWDPRCIGSAWKMVPFADGMQTNCVLVFNCPNP